jgi:phage recombination protein Bet
MSTNVRALAPTNQGGALALTEADLVQVLKSSFYPGATEASIKLVIAYCKAAQLDPMLKPVHIVPMPVKKPGSRDMEWRDVVMPGIGHYRIQATRSGVYLGKTEPEFGPDVTRTMGGRQVTFPQWCRVTVKKQVGSQVAEFTAREFWLENYATGGRDTDAPNAMWGKRPYGQLAKVAEAQALRQAFPELLGGTNTADEMEGRALDEVAIDVTPPAPAKPPAAARKALDAFAGQPDEKVIDVKAEVPQATDPFDEPGGHTAPDLPMDALVAFQESGKWMPAWKWISQNLASIDPAIRQEFVTEHSPILKAVSAYKDSYAKAVDDLLEGCGVSLDDDAS